MIDSMGVWDKIDFDFLNKRGIPLPEGLGQTIKSMSFKDTAEHFKKEFNLSETIEEIMNEWNAMAFDEYSCQVRLKPGAERYLAHLKAKGTKIGLATSACRELLEAVLKNNGVYHYFNAVSTVDEINKDKNCPDIYLLTARKLGLEPGGCVVFEDILPAVLSAKTAGMKVIGVYDRYSEHEKEEIIRFADHYIMDFNELISTAAIPL